MAHVPSSNELIQRVREIGRRHARATAEYDSMKRDYDNLVNRLREAVDELEREDRLCRHPLSRKKYRDDLRVLIRDLQDRIDIYRGPLRRLERKIRNLERDADVVAHFSRERRLMNRRVPQELADNIAAFNYRRRFPINDYDDDDA